MAFKPQRVCASRSVTSTEKYIMPLSWKYWPTDQIVFSNNYSNASITVPHNRKKCTMAKRCKRTYGY